MVNIKDKKMKKNDEKQLLNRRSFLKISGMGAGAGILGVQHAFSGIQKVAPPPPIQGFEDTGSDQAGSAVWRSVSDRKIRVGLIGYGVCKFAAAFGFQDHPNVEVVAVSDLIPERCAELAKITRCKKTYPSLEELIKDDAVEAVFIATDAPSHAQHTIDALNHGKHVACAVPAVWGSLDDAYRVYETVKKTGLTYMMFETSMFHESLYSMRTLYQSGHLGEIVYSEGEYYHYFGTPLDSFNGWRVGLPPQFYPTHSNAYHICVTGGSFTEVSCLGFTSIVDHLKPENNRYKNPFGTEVAMFRTSEGGISRMVVSWDTPGFGAEAGRVRGTRGSFYNSYQGLDTDLPDLLRPGLPPTVDAGGHGGSHGRLTDEFITAILLEREPLVNIEMALNLTVGGIVAHQSAMRNGETLKIPQFKS
jgi:predicted dehydrogenase